MPVYFVTGKLGSGKSLISVGKIRDKLNSGCKVATNIDLNLHKLINIKSRNATVYRIPDKPELQDLEAIGVGNDTYDEGKNGLLVLDECGTWFNSRSWGDKSRQDVINWFLHARKLGWDIIFLVQDISIVDKQAREALGEFVVYCRRLDRVGIPLVSPIVRFFTGIRITLPKAHFATVKYGIYQTSISVEYWLYTGKSLYTAYDTKQVYSSYYESRTYQVLPPYFSHYRYQVKKDLRYYMRITKIYWKRFSRPMALITGFFLGVLFTSGYLLQDLVQQKKAYAAEQHQQVQQSTSPLSGSRITGYSKLGDWENYRLLTPDLQHLSSDDIKARGYRLQPVAACHLIITKGTFREDVRC
ncbi:MAG: assembly protein [Marinospirillum sp.]|uniref:zonular occludens toxin domain-containing protein n=1 Tax=Marinospirillum sp. TaxID=2183934 RepID=UPI0019EB358A|nr:zonular occludens toxin domain-containing protein [Marinospirillum sp.]MBE0507547.1 assembly protein [Marinospirillum sp.]